MTQETESPDLPGGLIALQTRFEWTGQLADLNKAIQAGQDAVTATPPDHPDRAMFLSNLGAALSARFQRTGRQEDLDEPIQAAQGAVTATPPDHPDRARRLSNLGLALRTRFERTGQQEDLNKAIQAAQDAVTATPDDHPDRTAMLSSLGAALRTRFEQTGQADDLDAAVTCFREASTSPVAPPRLACAAARWWGQLMSGDEALEPFTTSLELLPRITPRWLGYTDLVGQVESVTGLGRDAAAAFIDAGDYERAVIAIEQATAITYSLISQSQTDLTELHDQDPTLATRIQTALNTLNQNTETNRSADSSPTAAETMMRTRQAAAADLDDALHQIRALGDQWERFFLPPAIHDLTATAPGPVVTVVAAERRCDALITTTSGVHHVPLPDLREDDAIANANRFLTATHTLSTPHATPQDQDTAEHDMIDVCDWLWHTVAEPILNHLGLTNPPGHDHYEKWPRLWWILTGPLAVLPIHAAGQHTHPGTAVIDRVISSYTPTIQTLTHHNRRNDKHNNSSRQEERTVVLVGMPHTPPRHTPHGPEPISSLPGVTRELERVANHLTNTHTTQLIHDQTDPNPTREALLHHLPHASWVHLACHATTDPINPTSSTLLLTDHQHHPFTVHDLTTTNATGHLMYLSACTTARPGLRTVDEPIHFAGAALLAGYHHVIATMWPLLDATSAEVADSIYDDLTTNGAPTHWTAPNTATAVHRATRDQRSKPTSIYHWATHTHYGP